VACLLSDLYFCLQILEGIATVVVGLLAFAVLYDFPSTASFLTPEEQAYVIWKKSALLLVSFLLRVSSTNISACNRI